MEIFCLYCIERASTSCIHECVFSGHGDAVARVRYIPRKVDLGVDLRICTNYGARKIFVENMTMWPTVEYSHIFCYFVERPGDFTKKELTKQSLKSHLSSSGRPWGTP